MSLRNDAWNIANRLWRDDVCAFGWFTQYLLAAVHLAWRLGDGVPSAEEAEGRVRLLDLELKLTDAQFSQVKSDLAGGGLNVLRAADGRVIVVLTSPDWFTRIPLPLQSKTFEALTQIATRGSYSPW